MKPRGHATGSGRPLPAVIVAMGHHRTPEPAPDQPESARAEFTDPQTIRSG